MGAPIYEELPGWNSLCTPVKGSSLPTATAATITGFDQLHENAQNYVRFIEEKVGVPVRLLRAGHESGRAISC
jgi:adenylosuccinate synthase